MLRKVSLTPNAMSDLGVLEEIAEHLADIAHSLRELLELAKDTDSEVDDA